MENTLSGDQGDDNGHVILGGQIKDKREVCPLSGDQDMVKLLGIKASQVSTAVNGDSVSPIASASAGAEGPIPPKTAEQKQARKNKLKAKSTRMLAIPDEHLLKFHACKDVKSLWEAIKNRFGGNKESKKM
ncbi:hypothetical protein Tco_1251871 [Tanacetum coccineum]